MYKIQTLDRISAIGLDNFPRDNYEIASILADYVVQYLNTGL